MDVFDIINLIVMSLFLIVYAVQMYFEIVYSESSDEWEKPFALIYIPLLFVSITNMIFMFIYR